MAQKSNTQKTIKGISSQALVTLVIGVVEIVSFSIMSRLLTQEDFGYYAAISAITTIFASFSETGIGAAIVQRKNITQKFINNAFTLSLVFGTCITIIMIASSGILSRLVSDESIKIPLMVISITIFCNCLASVNKSILQKRMQFLTIGAINLVSLVITTIIAVTLALQGYGFYAILIKGCLYCILVLVLSYFFAKTKYKLSLDKYTVKSILGFSGWLMASAFFRNLAQQVDRLLLSRLLSVSLLGAYNRPKEFITQISTKLNGIFDTALFPVLSDIQDNEESLKRSYKSSTYYLNIFSIGLMLLFVVNSNLIIRIFFGEDWLKINNVFQILSVALLLNIDGRLVDCYFRSLALTRQQFNFRIVEFLIKLLFLLIGSYWKLVGVATSLVIANMVMIFIKMEYLSHKINIPFFEMLKYILKAWRFSFLVIPILVALMFYLPNTLSGNIILAVLFVFILALVFLCFPSLVGVQYKEEVYNKVIDLFKNFLRRAVFKS